MIDGVDGTFEMEARDPNSTSTLVRHPIIRSCMNG
jgi:hypothetical protein